MSQGRLALVVTLIVTGLSLWLIGPADAGPTYGGKKVSAKEQALIELGRRLFFDPLVSRSGERSCASCHDPEYGFSDPMIVSEDDVGETVRHSQTIIDSHLNPTAHWDGEFDSIEELVFARIGLPQGVRGLRGHGAPFVVSNAGSSTPVQQNAPGSPAVTIEPAPADGPPTGHMPSQFFEPKDTSGRGGGSGGGGYGPPSPTAPPPPAPRPTTPTAPPAREPADADPLPSKDDGGGGDKDGGGGAEDKDDSEPSNDAPRDVNRDDEDGPEALAPGSEGKKDGEDDEEQEEEKEDIARPFDVKDLSKLPRVQDLLEESGRYNEAFKAAFGSTSVTTARMAQAIAAYCRSITSTESPYDRFVKGDKTAISESAQRGLELFKGRAGCAKCHTVKGKHAPFTDFDFHNTGISWHLLPAETRDRLRKSDRLKSMDSGRERISRRGRDRRAFKTPTLRDLTRRGPYMHTGVFDTLHDVVRYYAAGATDDPKQDRRLKGFEASEQDVVDLVAFLESLTGDEIPGRAPVAWHVRPESTRLRLVDAAGKPMPSMPVTLYPVGDRLPGATERSDNPIACETDEKGWFEFAPTRRTHVRVELPEGLELSHGDLVPDTTAKIDLVVPVKGKTVLMLSRNADRPLPETLVAEHLDTIVLPGHAAPRTKFRRGRIIETGGVKTARYEAWFRTDLPCEVRLRLPSERELTDKDLTLKLKSGKVLTLDLSH